MGILAATACLLLQEGKRQPYHGRLLQLGRQDIWFNLDGLRTIANHVGFTLRLPPDDMLPDPTQRLTDDFFFKALGFTQVESMEYGTEESANYIHDLNAPVAPTFFEKFDAIYDGGTVEHVFNIPQCLSNICHMLTIGGRIIHDAGVSGMIDHGFYALQPTLFYDYYLAQQFSISACTINSIDKDVRFTHFVTNQTVYQPGMYDFEKTWALSATDTFGVFFSATKTQSFRKAIPPQQSIWARFAALQALAAQR